MLPFLISIASLTAAMLVWKIVWVYHKSSSPAARKDPDSLTPNAGKPLLMGHRCTITGLCNLLKDNLAE